MSNDNKDKDNITLLVQAAQGEAKTEAKDTAPDNTPSPEDQQSSSTDHPAPKDQPSPNTQHPSPGTEGPSLKEVIEEQATEGEAPLAKTFTLRKILGGDILNTAAVRRQIGVLLLITFFILVYIANRYQCQQDMIRIDKLNRELQDAKYRALSSSSQLTEKSRESNVLEMLKENNDSTLKIPSQPPYKINVPQE